MRDVVTPSLAPVVQESTPSMVARTVREAIAAGHFRPGAQLGEADLAARLGVSRGPLREGLQRLTAEGLLVSVRNRGVFVVEMTPERVRDMYVARQAVERAAAEQIHAGDPAAAALALGSVTGAMSRARDSRSVGDLDIAFHVRLVELAGSPRLQRMHEVLITETRMCIHALAESYARSGEVRGAEHEAIATSFADRDPARTDRLLVEHMRDAVQRLVGPP